MSLHESADINEVNGEDADGDVYFDDGEIHDADWVADISRHSLNVLHDLMDKYGVYDEEQLRLALRNERGKMNEFGTHNYNSDHLSPEKSSMSAPASPSR